MWDVCCSVDQFVIPCVSSSEKPSLRFSKLQGCISLSCRIARKREKEAMLSGIGDEVAPTCDMESHVRIQHTSEVLLDIDFLLILEEVFGICDVLPIACKPCWSTSKGGFA